MPHGKGVMTMGNGSGGGFQITSKGDMSHFLLPQIWFLNRRLRLGMRANSMLDLLTELGSTSHVQVRRSIVENSMPGSVKGRQM